MLQSQPGDAHEREDARVEDCKQTLNPKPYSDAQEREAARED